MEAVGWGGMPGVEERESPGLVRDVMALRGYAYAAGMGVE